MLRNVQIILGPPGTGKTTTLLNIVEGALARGIKPEKIAYLAFTRKAAYEAQERAISKFGYDESRFPYFRTLHSLAFKELGLSRSEVMTNSHYKKLGKTLGMTKQEALQAAQSFAAFDANVRKSLLITFGDEQTFDLVKGLKTQHKEAVNQQAYALLEPNDWMVVRNAESSKAIPSDWLDFRVNVRSTASSMKTKINAVSDVDALAALYVYNDQDPPTRPLGEWPTQPSS
jgi:superfamily I DNA/RNA helicase